MNRLDQRPIDTKFTWIPWQSKIVLSLINPSCRIFKCTFLENLVGNDMPMFNDACIHVIVGFDNHTTNTIQLHACQTWSHDYWCVTYYDIDKLTKLKHVKVPIYHKNSRQQYKLTCNFNSHITLPLLRMNYLQNTFGNWSHRCHTDAYVYVDVFAAYLCGLRSVGWEKMLAFKHHSLSFSLFAGLHRQCFFVACQLQWVISKSLPCT